MEPIGYISGSTPLDAVFGALSDPTRRAILLRLTKGEASVSELARPGVMSQPAISKHLKILERAGLIEREPDKQRRLSRLNVQPMADAMQWLANFKAFWSGSFDELDILLADLQRKHQGEK